MRKSPRKRFSAESRRDQIVESSISCLVSRGVANTTLRDIAKFAQIDPPLIHYYFPTVQTLYAEVIEKILNSLKETTIQSLSGHTNATDSLESYVRGYFYWARKNRGLYSLWLYFYYLASYDQSYTQINTLIREAGRERFKVLIKNWMLENGFRSPNNRNLDQIVYNIHGLLTGNFVTAFTEKSDVKTADRIAEITLNMIVSILSMSK